MQARHHNIRGRHSMRFRTFWLALPLALTACGYNQIQKLDEQAQSSKQTIDVQLQRRADLIPNLVASVKGYATHESDVFTKVAAARGGLVNAIKEGDPEKTANANAMLTGALGRLIAVAEAYPELKANE